MKPALVVLAAGASRRLGRCKALVDLAGVTPLERLLSAGAGLADDRPLVVTGADHDAIAAFVARHDLFVEVVHNADWAAGRTGSAAAARRARPGRDLCLAPVDVPLVPPQVFDALVDAWETAGRPGGGWLAPRVTGDDDSRGGTSRDEPRVEPRISARVGNRLPENVSGRAAFGHPVIVGHALAARLEELAPGEPLRALRALARPLLAVDVASRTVLDDLDTAEDLEALRLRAHMS